MCRLELLQYIWIFSECYSVEYRIDRCYWLDIVGIIDNSEYYMWYFPCYLLNIIDFGLLIFEEGGSEKIFQILSQKE